MCNPGRDWRAHLLDWQLGGHLGVDHRPADHVDQIQERQEKTREHRSCVEFHHGLPSHRCIDDDHHRGWDENPQRATSGDDPGSHSNVIARIEHRTHRDHTHQDHNSAHQTACDPPERADNKGRYRERSRHTAERKPNAVEHPVHERTALHDVSHQHEKRNRQKRLVGHRPESALHHQVKNTIVVPRDRWVVERHKSEHHAKTHQRKRRREAQHDHHNDERQHREPERRITHDDLPPPVAR